MIRVNKIWLRIFVVFLIHIIIKSFDLSFTGGPFEWNLRSLTFSVYFMSYSLLIWYVGEWFDTQLRKRFQESEGDWKKTILIVLSHMFFAFLIMLTVNHFYRLGDIYLFNNYHLWKNISLLNPELTVSLTILYLTIYGFNSYSNMHFQLQEKMLVEEKLKKENITAQYQALKAQIEPHFLFNSLSTLSSLVYEDVNLSSDFIVKLSKTLRYVIEKNEFHLVKLNEELEFLYAYFFLIKTRLDEGVFLDIELDNSTIDTTYIPPVTLQLLVENAVNHNTYNPEKPLKVKIRQESNHIIVENNLNPRTVFKESTKQGLRNISKRYELLSTQGIEILKTDHSFIVKLPLLNQSDYENFNI